MLDFRLAVYQDRQLFFLQFRIDLCQSHEFFKRFRSVSTLLTNWGEEEKVKKNGGKD